MRQVTGLGVVLVELANEAREKCSEKGTAMVSRDAAGGNGKGDVDTVVESSWPLAGPAGHCSLQLRVFRQGMDPH